MIIISQMWPASNRERSKDNTKVNLIVKLSKDKDPFLDSQHLSLRRMSNKSDFFSPIEQKESDQKKGKQRKQVKSNLYQNEDYKEDYAKECLEYEKYSFDQQIRATIHRISSRTYSRTHSLSLPKFFINRALCFLSKKFLFNRIELIFLDYFFQQTGWDIDHPIIKTYSKGMRLFIQSSEQSNPEALQLYLVFCGCSAKSTLNTSSKEIYLYFGQFLNKTIDDFESKHAEWMKSAILSRSSQDLNPRMLNTVFKKLILSNERDLIQNYDFLTESILEISPAYNAAKEKKPRKKRRIQIAQDDHSQHQEEDYAIDNIRVVRRTSSSSNLDGLERFTHYRSI